MKAYMFRPSHGITLRRMYADARLTIRVPGTSYGHVQYSSALGAETQLPVFFLFRRDRSGFLDPPQQQSMFTVVGLSYRLR